MRRQPFPLRTRMATPVVVAVLVAVGLGAGPALAAPPTNDNFSSPTTLTGTVTSSTGTTVEATTQPDEPVHGTAGSASVWFAWWAPGDGPVTIDTCESEFDTVLAVYTGSSLASLTEVASNDDDPTADCDDDQARISFTAQIGIRYRIALAGQDGATGPYTINLDGGALTLANDDFADAIELVGTDASHLSHNLLATEEAGEPITDFDHQFGGRTIWYRWTAPATGVYEVDTCAPGGDPDLQTVLGVYTGSAVDTLTPVVRGYSAQGSGHCVGTNKSGLIFEATAGVTYSIQVGGVWFSMGVFPPQAGAVVTSLFASTRPANDDFAFARKLGGHAATLTQSTMGAGVEPGEPAHAGVAAATSVWFEWSAPAGTEVRVDTCGSSHDTVLAVYSGPRLDLLEPVVADVGTAACGVGASAVSFTAASGSRYWIAVDGRDGATGSLTLALDQDAPAGIDWRTIASITETIGEVLLRVDADDLGDGTRLLWWTLLTDGLHGHVQAARVEADGTVGPVVDLTEPGGMAAGADLAVLPDGSILLYTLVIDHQTQAHTAARRFTAALEPVGDPIVVSQPSPLPDGPKLVVAPDGTATFAWADATDVEGGPRHFVARLRRMAPDGTLGPIVDLSETEEQTAGQGRPNVDGGVALAVAPDGTVTLAWEWEARVGVRSGEIQVVQVSPDGDIGPVRTVAALGNRPVVGAAPDGSALIAWVDGDITSPGVNPLTVVRLRADGTLGAPLHPDEVDPPTQYATQELRITVSDTGRAFVTWHRVTSASLPAVKQVRGRLVEPDDTLGPLVLLSQPTASDFGFVAFPRAGFDRWGNLTVSWTRLTEDGSSHQSQARRMTAGGVWGPVTDLTALPVQASPTDLLVDSTGVATVAQLRLSASQTFIIDAVELPVADLSISAATAGPGAATLVVANSGPRASEADADTPIRVTLDAPPDTIDTVGGPGWTCAVSADAVCTLAAGIDPLQQAPPIHVALSPGSPTSIGLGSTVHAGGTIDPNPANDETATTVEVPDDRACTVPTGVELEAAIVGVDPDGPVTAGGTYTWTVELVATACEDVTEVSAQGGGVGWATTVSQTDDGTIGARRHNRRNTVWLWDMGELTTGQTATATLTITGRVDKKAGCGSEVELTGAWSITATAQSEGAIATTTDTAGPVTADVTCDGDV